MKPRLIPNTAAFYEALRDRREALGLHHLELDDMTGLADGHLSKIEGFDREWGKRPFNITPTAEWLMETLDLALVVMPRKDAMEITDRTVNRKITQRAGRDEGRAIILSYAVRYPDD